MSDPYRKHSETSYSHVTKLHDIYQSDKGSSLPKYQLKFDARPLDRFIYPKGYSIIPEAREVLEIADNFHKYDEQVFEQTLLNAREEIRKACALGKYYTQSFYIGPVYLKPLEKVLKAKSFEEFQYSISSSDELNEGELLIAIQWKKVEKIV